MAFKLTILERGDPNSEYVRSFVGERVLLGRARSSDVCLPDMAVSTRHAEIRLKENSYAVVDLGSVNGTAVNGKMLLAHRPRTLQAGDQIDIANFRIGFQPGAQAGGTEPRELAIDQARQMIVRVLARAGLDTLEESRERSLRAIYEAPEEETSSFGYVAPGAPEPGGAGSEPKSEKAGAAPSAPVPEAEVAPLPVGPADPLSVEEPASPAPPRTPRAQGSDLGLIVIGGIIVVLAVVGLVYLLK